MYFISPDQTGSTKRWVLRSKSADFVQAPQAGASCVGLVALLGLTLGPLPHLFGVLLHGVGLADLLLFEQLGIMRERRTVKTISGNREEGVLRTARL
jgi:hypothetical protein